MDEIWHEQQEGSLCAQHCLNALLQGPFFTAVDLASISEQLDEEERQRMAEGGVNADEYQRFLAQPSSNMDDSGFFSVQVISNALDIWGLQMVAYASTDPVAVAAREAPVDQQAFVCNFREHWFTIRKIGQQWFNLNSMLTGPELLSETYISLFLEQLAQDGYSIFVVTGELPPCDAEEILNVTPAVQTVRPQLIQTDKKKSNQSTASHASHTSTASDAAAMEWALEQSRHELDDDDAALQRAMELSLLTAPPPTNDQVADPAAPTQNAQNQADDDQPADQQ